MRLRTVTCFYNPAVDGAEDQLRQLVKLAQLAEKRFGDAGYEVQTTRLATVPFSYYLPVRSKDAKSIGRIAQEMETQAMEAGFSFLSLGPAIPSVPASYPAALEILTATQNSFVTGVMAAKPDGVYLDAVRACAKIIAGAAVVSPDGFTNLRFSALANVLPFTPFFPSAYHEGIMPAFSIAIESADVAWVAFDKAKDLAGARIALLSKLERHTVALEKIAQEIEQQFDIPFKGFDISLAPYPEGNCSLGGAIEKLGPEKIGYCGSLAAAAFVADTLDLGRWKKVGFNGLMLPVLEDAGLAQRSIDGSLTIKDLLMFSAVCGTGLDTVPLPGDTSVEQLSAILMDVAALSTRLAKPLTARLMPVPGMKAGQPTSFDFSFFANGAVMDLVGEKIHGPLAGAESFLLCPRR